MPKLSKKARLKKQATFLIKKAEWDVFRGLCNFFGLSIEEIYILLKKNSDIEVYYPHTGSFKIAVVNRPVAIMNKENVRDGVINISSILKEDCFYVMNHEIEYSQHRRK